MCIEALEVENLFSCLNTWCPYALEETNNISEADFYLTQSCYYLYSEVKEISIVSRGLLHTLQTVYDLSHYSNCY